MTRLIFSAVFANVVLALELKLFVQNREEVSMGHLSRQTTSNDPPRPKSKGEPWLGESELMDRTALILSGSAKKCVACGRLAHINNLDHNCLCPSCN